MLRQLQDAGRGEDSCAEEEPEDGAELEESRPGAVNMPPPPPGAAPAGAGQQGGGGGGAGRGMSRSVSDTTLRKHALSLNLSQSVLPSFTPLHQFKVTRGEKYFCINKNIIMTRIKCMENHRIKCAAYSYLFTRYNMFYVSVEGILLTILITRLQF